MATVFAKLDSSQLSRPAREEDILARKTVVIVDDSPRQRKTLRDLYESFGLVCVGEARDGLEGTVLVERARPDLVSLDVLMPTMHGVEAFATMRANGYDGIVIFVTALQRTDLLNDLRVKGQQPDAVIAKTDSRETFRSVLQDVFLAEEARRRVESEQRSGQDKESDLDESA